MLICIPFHFYHRIYGLWGILLTHITYTKKKSIQSRRYPFRHQPPRKRRDRNSPQIIPVDASCWIPRLSMVLSAIQASWRLTWSYQCKSSPSFFVINGLDCCITTINSNLTWGRMPKALCSFLWPTKPPISKMAMISVKDLAHETPLQPVFDTNARKFLIDSGASTHLWNPCQDLSSYHRLSREEQEQDKVLGVNGKTIKPIRMGTVLLKIEDDLNHVHALEIQDVRHMCLKSRSTSLSPKPSSNNINPRDILLHLAPLIPQG